MQRPAPRQSVTSVFIKHIEYVRWPRRAFHFCLRATQIVRFAQQKLRASLNGNCVLLPTRFTQQNLRASLNGNCVLLPTHFAQRKLHKLHASLNGNCVLLPTEIVCFSQRSSLNRNCVLRPTLFAQRKLCASPNGNCASPNILRPTQTLSFAQRNIQCNNIFFSSYSYKRISFFTVTIVWTVLHICHCCHYMSLIIGTAHAMSRVSIRRLYMLGCDTPIFSNRVAQNSQTRQLLDIYTYSSQISVPCRVKDVVILLHAHIYPLSSLW